ncbi:TPA: hypothetical protein ACPFPA_001432 [Pseudomonas aeruginosa]|uniref:hypothetical protein n=1 Tax=Pseudomonas aeruginosa TaxID=287 RepID=UPI000C2B780B|nr:hypothetical protein [Pseudomonas aeruginosa]AUA85202.1 hypothetical protein CWI22_23345 [Pseudomonas aeruginosa]AUA90007.1 hypothetical protein CWI23_16520 [Pseudomonas aeruginosa]AUA91293.1 hypothetical protein CWI23_23390 [Pseudomonas aeruginosa]MCS7821909.1 hypothetical protein [Pseudomonas aeruginosa]
MADQKNYREQAAEACIRFSAVLDEINAFKSQIAEALEKCEKPFEMLAGQCGPDPIYVAQTHLGRYFQNGGRLPVDSWLGEEPADELDSDIFECEACLEAFKLCIQRKKLRQKRGQALRLVRYYGRKAREVTRG